MTFICKYRYVFYLYNKDIIIIIIIIITTLYFKQLIIIVFSTVTKAFQI